MIVRINHLDISENEKTYLTSACVAAATTLTVQNIEGFSVGQYAVLGKLGEEKTEIVRIHTATAPSGSTITLNAAISFAHPINTPIAFIAYNQVAVYSATSKGGTYTQCSGSPVNIGADQSFTIFTDSSGSTTTWYKTRYYNSSTTTYSSYSDEVGGTGYTEASLRKIIDKANAQCNDRENKLLTEEEKVDIVNDGYEQIINRLDKADHKRFVKKGYVDVKNSYNTGSVAVNDASATVTGTGTTWVVTWTGKKIIFSDEGFPYEVSSVSGAGTLTLTRTYNGAGSNLSGATYKIFQDEYDLYSESTGVEIADFKKIEQVVDEDGNIVNEYDPHRTETGYYLKREGDNLKLCLNYQPATSDAEGRWTIWYRYQPAKLDSMADEPEFPQGYSSILVSYLEAKIEERKGGLNKAQYYMGEFLTQSNKMIRESNPRTNEKKSFRLDRNLSSTQEHDDDWIDDVYSRTTISGTSWS